MASSRDRGFSLIELTIVGLVLGMIIGFGLPAFLRFSSTLQLHSAAENITGQLRLAREKAIATGVEQPMTFEYGYLGESDYRTTPAVGVGGSWRLPKGITYAAEAEIDSTYEFQRDGRCDRAGVIILENQRGNRDTVSIQLSGIVFNH